MNKNNKRSAEKLERKTIERNRRIHMKALCHELTSLIPQKQLNPSKDTLSFADQIDEATNYIKQLKEGVEALKSRRKEGIARFEFRDFGTGDLEVAIVSELKKKFMLREIITILEDGGAEVVTASVPAIADEAFYTLHARVKVSRIGVDTSRVCERLHVLISETGTE